MTDATLGVLQSLGSHLKGLHSEPVNHPILSDPEINHMHIQRQLSEHRRICYEKAMVGL